MPGYRGVKHHAYTVDGYRLEREKGKRVGDYQIDPIRAFLSLPLIHGHLNDGLLHGQVPKLKRQSLFDE